jgi:hypothetical protein
MPIKNAIDKLENQGKKHKLPQVIKGARLFVENYEKKLVK